jgi:hypothetical protein
MLDLQIGGSGTPATGLSDEEGRFHVDDIAPGTYRVMTGVPPRRVASVSDPSDGMRAEVTGGVFVAGTTTNPLSSHATTAASREITVGNSDVTGLRIVVRSWK